MKNAFVCFALCVALFRAGSSLAGEVPIPFNSLNHYFELADGEFYYLQGEISDSTFVSYIELDAHVYRALASQKRLDQDAGHLRYLIVGAMNLSKFDGQKVGIIAQAKYQFRQIVLVPRIVKVLH